MNVTFAVIFLLLHISLSFGMFFEWTVCSRCFVSCRTGRSKERKRRERERKTCFPLFILALRYSVNLVINLNGIDN